jgi:hypothetical protein
LFDGETLSGWHAVPRLPTPQVLGEPWPDPDSPEVRAAAATAGRWQVCDGAIVGGQGVEGFGGYLLTDRVFADFELQFEVKPDWPVDTGVLVRTRPIGTQGFQILIDHRKSGSIGGFYGNGIGGFHLWAFNLDADYDADGTPIGLRVETEETTLEPFFEERWSPLSYAIDPQEFLDTWRWGDWNRLRIRCAGQHPVLTTWVNEVKAYEVDAGAIDLPTYDREATFNLLGRAGHIALEVHHNDARMGPARWAPGAVSRWRDIAIREL